MYHRIQMLSLRNLLAFRSSFAQVAQISLIFLLSSWPAHAQDDAAALRKNAVPIVNPERLPDSIFPLLMPFKVILMGELHGTNEAPQFTYGLVELLLRHGDSVLLGLEIPSGQMQQFLSQRTDSSLSASDFFLRPVFESGKESEAWASLILRLKDNPGVHIFFYDVDTGEGEGYKRDKRMALKIKDRIIQHPGWKMVALGGNVHNQLFDAGAMLAWLQEDKDLRLSDRICALNMEYSSGTCRANFGDGLQEKQLRRTSTVFDTALGCEKYFALFTPKWGYTHHGFFYTRSITAAKMTAHR
jgi:hypothetical protein